MGDLFLLAITCVCRLHWSARRGSWSRVVETGCGLHSYEAFVENRVALLLSCGVNLATTVGFKTDKTFRRVVF
eukprot:scaffold32671_cov65-Phaeocystis_antarctica.AAC.3